MLYVLSTYSKVFSFACGKGVEQLKGCIWMKKMLFYHLAHKLRHGREWKSWNGKREIQVQVIKAVCYSVSLQNPPLHGFYVILWEPRLHCDSATVSCQPDQPFRMQLIKYLLKHEADVGASYYLSAQGSKINEKRTLIYLPWANEGENVSDEKDRNGNDDDDEDDEGRRNRWFRELKARLLLNVMF